MPGAYLSQLIPDKIDSMGRAVSVEIVVIHTGIGREEKKGVVSPVPLADDIIFEITSNPTAVENGIGDILENQAFMIPSPQRCEEESIFRKVKWRTSHEKNGSKKKEAGKITEGMEK